jgi:hypothetical protein
MYSILRTLHEIGRTMPPEVLIDFNDLESTASRTGASIHLMLFQVSTRTRLSTKTLKS